MIHISSVTFGQKIGRVGGNVISRETMAMPLVKKSKKNQIVAARYKRGQEDIPWSKRLLQTRKIARSLSFIGFGFLLIFICFVGQFPPGLLVLPNQIARIRIVADYPFSYESQIQTKRLEDKLRKQIAPIYKIDEEPIQIFLKNLATLHDGLDNLADNLNDKTPQEKTTIIDQFTKNFERTTSIFVNNDDVSLILEKTDNTKRNQIFQEGAIILRDITRDGIYAPPESSKLKDSTSSFFFNIQIEGRQKDINVQTEKDALRRLSLNLGTLDVDWPLARALFRVFKTGAEPNLAFDSDKTETKIESALSAIGNVTVDIKEGQTIIEPGSTIGPEQLEQLKSYRNFTKEHELSGLGFNVTLYERSFLTFFILFTVLLCVGIGIPDILESTRHLTRVGITIASNLALIRLLLELGDSHFFENNPGVLAMLPFICPIIVGPLIAALILGPTPAIVIAVLVSTFYALMLGSGISFALIALFSSLIGVYFCKNIRLRNKVVRAGTIAGATFAVFAGFSGIANQTDLNIISCQMIFALSVGILSSIVTIGVLPFLENFFKITTDITLLELTDFNHPLLSRLQLEAPGTYHHSLMVANLSERAAAKIDANPLVCRACSIFHDIGKMAKPEYFVENQSTGVNPHMDRNPSMSALVIKSHIKEGLLLAKKFKLPKVILDGIEQHHGTTLIKYFYDKAQKKIQEKELPLGGQIDYSDEDTVEESTFRYDGPKPSFKESAIIFFADSVEAASRTLKKASSTSIKELIESIFQEKLDDHQLDECPLTLQEIQLLKESFAFTLLNMLHARIEYPDKDNSSQE